MLLYCYQVLLAGLNDTGILLGNPASISYEPAGSVPLYVNGLGRSVVMKLRSYPSFTHYLL